MTELVSLGQAAKSAAGTLRIMGAEGKNGVLRKAAAALIDNMDFILSENGKDMNIAAENGMAESLMDRLRLTGGRVRSMSDGLLQVSDLPDPVGKVLDMRTLPNGLTVGRRRVPLGVVGIIYEARPNVTSDAFGLCFKAGNAVILRGGKEAIGSNAAIVHVIQDVIQAEGLDGALGLVTDTSRETAAAFMRLREYVDVLIPRGGAGLIDAVVKNSNIPVIETGTGNCHIFVDESVDMEAAERIIINAKTQRPSVCNACEKLLVHEGIAADFLPRIYAALHAAGVEVRGDLRACSLCPGIIPAKDEDWGREYLDMVIAVAVVKDAREAAGHIARYSSGHSEAILTESYANAQFFLDAVDSAAVYVNASTRFTDGEQFGLGAEIGISTQKLHVRGPMGLEALTSSKYVIYGSGQIRG